MSEELEKKEPQETPENANNVPEPDDLEAISGQLEEERQAKAAVEATLAERDTRIAELETQLNEAATARESFASQLYDANEAHTQAVAKYLEAVKAANPAIPQDVITGESIEAIDASVQQATAIAEAVKANLATEAKNVKVPAGAPSRAVNIDGLDPRDKITLGLSQQKGGM